MIVKKYVQYFVGLVVSLVILIITIATIFFILNKSNIIKKPETTVDASRSSVIQKVQSLNRLETASYTVEKIIEAGVEGNPFQDLIYGDKILLVAHGNVIAGFDLNTFNKENIKVHGSTLTLMLPAPVIISSNLDTNQTKVYDRKQGLLSKGDKDLETKARASAEASIKEAACQDGILEKASENAKGVFSSIFSSTQFTQIVVEIPRGSC